MSRPDASKLVMQALYAVAPDLQGESIAADKTFREQFEFDSMDFLNFVIALHRASGLEIPEKDYPQLQSLSGAVSYLRTHEPSAG
ncbi:acyl carrier protein [Rhizobium binae]|uniref:acyl carrier protein n=1 Tax=Rhizobium binae TaxID=1138190 RepID=UPI001C83A836|nr:phosphopantetheine-binding protein [Rhizobium binae]MBX4924417.1 acyl carrier protein [Rhizobium binae]